NLGVVVGADGRDGTNGTDGADGRDGVDGTNGADGQDGVGVASTSINAAGELVITYTDGTTANLGVVVGADGRDGTNGTDGADGRDGVDGTNGADGRDGVDGTNGADGQDGIGISNVEINAADELVLTFSDGASINLGNIKGAKGDQGDKGDKGDKGDAGTNGTDGVNGADGVGIADVTVSASGVLSVTLTNGTVLNLGNIKGADGIGITNVEINAADELVLTLSDGASINLGNIKGAKGDTGDAGANGTDGADGVGIATVTVATDGTLTVTLTNGTAFNLGNIKGEKGDKGDKGDTGEKGDKGDKGDAGADGRGIANMEMVDDHLVITYTDGAIQNLSGFVSTDTYMLNFNVLSSGNLEVSIKSEYKNIVREISIPSTFAGRQVTKIADEGFYNCIYLETVTIPNTITVIGTGAFSACKALETITLPNSLKTIGHIAFSDTNLTTIFIPASVTKIGVKIAPDSLTTAYFEKQTGWKKTDILSRKGGQAFTDEVLGITSYPNDATSTISDPTKAANLLKYSSYNGSSNTWYYYALKNQE
ncbi:MAG: leucine-rich repeat protein, partial [Clostridia bacterium]|nr:leucine-rich repeat protein [Clostridia bacterium]